MKKRQVIYSIFFINLLFISIKGYTFPDKGNTKLSKTITEGFKTISSPEIIILNKYGEITFEHWAKDSVKIEVEIMAYGRTESIAEDLLDRVEIDFSDTESRIKVETELDNEGNPISAFFNKLMDYQKAVFSENNLKIQYKIYAPKTSKLDITNKFGDFYSPEIAKNSKIFLSYGNLKIGKINPNSTVEVRFGSANIREFSDGFLRSKISNIEIKNASKIDVESHSSTIEIDKISHLILNSRNDKIYIDEVKNLEGTGYFSRFEIDNFSGQINTELTYGKLSIDNIQSSFSRVKINAKATDIELDFDENAEYTLLTEGKKGNVNLPKSLLSLKTETVPNGRNVEMSGKIGSQNPKNVVTIRANGGEITIK